MHCVVYCPRPRVHTHFINWFLTRNSHDDFEFVFLQEIGSPWLSFKVYQNIFIIFKQKLFGQFESRFFVYFFLLIVF